MVATAAAGAAANPAAAAAANADPLPDWNVLTPALADFNSFSVTRALPPLLQLGTPKVLYFAPLVVTKFQLNSE